MSRLFPIHPEAKKRKEARLRQRLAFSFLFVLIVFIAIVYVGIRFTGGWLVFETPFQHATWVAVLDGQSANMERTDLALELLQQGRADSVIILGRRVFRERSFADFYLEDMQKQGSVDLSRVFLLRHDDNSTMEEAESLIPILKQRGVDSVLLITSPQATRRAKRIFEKMSGKGIVFLTTVISDPYYNSRTWIHHRNSRKVWLTEWASYLVSFFDLAFIKQVEPISGKPYLLEPALSTIKTSAEELVPIEVQASSSQDGSSSSSMISSSSVALPELEEKEPVKETEAKQAETKKATEKAKDTKKPVDKKSEKTSEKKSDKKSEKDNAKKAKPSEDTKKVGKKDAK